MKEKIVGFLSNAMGELVVGGVLFGLAAINAVQVNAGSYGDLSEWAKICVIAFMAVFGMLFINNGVIPAVVALLKLLKIMK